MKKGKMFAWYNIIKQLSKRYPSSSTIGSRSGFYFPIENKRFVEKIRTIMPRKFLIDVSSTFITRTINSIFSSFFVCEILYRSFF